MKVTTTAGQSTSLTIEESDTSHMKNIVSYIFPAFFRRFAAKNDQYGENDFALGPKAQFPEIWRKCARLRAIIWEGRADTEVFENVDEVIDDLMGHLLMLKDCLSRGRGAKDPTPEPVTIAHTPNTPPRRKAANSFPPITETIDPTPGAEQERAAHLIREAKDGPETWVDQGRPAATASVATTDETGVKRYSPNFRGRASYMVGEMDQGRLMMSAHGHVIRVAHEPTEQRCGWRTGDPAERSGDNQCVGIEGHGDPVDVGGITGIIKEDYHINKELEAWPV